jgi:hypothetical protein
MFLLRPYGFGDITHSRHDEGAVQMNLFEADFYPISTVPKRLRSEGR